MGQRVGLEFARVLAGNDAIAFVHFSEAVLH